MFLEKCRQQFPELRGTNVDNLMYVKVNNPISIIPLLPFDANVHASTHRKIL
jgi:hypothetical protein